VRQRSPVVNGENREGAKSCAKKVWKRAPPPKGGNVEAKNNQREKGSTGKFKMWPRGESEDPRPRVRSWKKGLNARLERGFLKVWGVPKKP